MPAWCLAAVTCLSILWTSIQGNGRGEDWACGGSASAVADRNGYAGRDTDSDAYANVGVAGSPGVAGVGGFG